jgi:hypothetical protein
VSHPARALVTFGAALASALVIATTLAVIVAIVLATAHGILESRPVRRRRARHAVRIARRARRARTAIALDRADASVHAYGELADIVDTVAVLDEHAAAELEPLLDNYVEVALARSRCRAALDQGDVAWLELQLAISHECRPRETEVLERRVAQGRRIAARLAELDDSLAAVAELLRYCAERASLPEIEPLLADDVLGSALAAAG